MQRKRSLWYPFLQGRNDILRVKKKEKGASSSVERGRLFYTIMELLNVFDYETLAETRLDPATWAFFAGGADDEITLRANRSAFERLQLRPRALIDVSMIDTSTNVLGIPIKTPLLIAPTGWQGLALLAA